MLKNDSFFDEQKLHTKIKLDLFEETLSKSIIIANNIIRNINYKNKYTYIDLYSGIGLMQDEKKGSPFIALDKIQQQAVSTNNYFSGFDVFLFEKKQEHCQQLSENISNSIFHSKINPKISCGDWHEEYKSVLCPEKPNSYWGFIFVDPYQDQLELSKLLRFSKCINKVDMMIFFNMTEIKRQCKNPTRTHELKLFKGLTDLPHSKILEYIDNEEFFPFFESIIRRYLGAIKDKFIIHVTLPVARKGIIHELDYSLLSLITGQQGVADAFLNKYNEELEKYKRNFNQLSIIEENTLSEVLDLMGKNTDMNFYELIEYVWSKPIKWTTPHYFKVPTIRHIFKEINQLLKKGILVAHCDTKYKKQNSNLLKVESFKKVQNLKEITFKFNN